MGGWGLQGWILGGIKEFCGGPGEIFGGDLGIAGRIWGFWGVGGFFGGFWGDFGRDWGFGGGVLEKSEGDLGFFGGIWGCGIAIPQLLVHSYLFCSADPKLLEQL